MIKSKMNDTKHVLNQYKDGKNLETRISLYDKYSVNSTNYTTWIHENYKFFEGCQILEFGTGTGKDWKDRITDLPFNCSLVLSDFSEGMVDELKSSFGSNKQVEVMKLDIQNTHFGDHSKDFVIANSMLYHVPDINKAVREVSRVLKNSGTFYAATPGNKTIFQYFKETFLKTNSRITLPKTLSFTLENGAEYLEKCFNHVEVSRYVNRLEITNTNDLVDFFYSMASIEGLMESDRNEIYDYYEKQKNSKDVIEIEIEYGMFIAKKRS